jgi:hypothetical protein
LKDSFSTAVRPSAASKGVEQALVVGSSIRPVCGVMVLSYLYGIGKTDVPVG